MPVFTVQDIAKLARKDEKTIRIWCSKGFVPGAKRKRGGAGRHWRIEGTNAATVAGLSLRAAQGYSRNRKRTIGGKVIPSEMLEQVRRMKNRLRLRRDDEVVRWSFAASLGESFDEGEVSFAVLMGVDKVREIANALANLIVQAGPSSNHAQFLGAQFGWSRATFYRKFGKLLPMARKLANTLDAKDGESFNANSKEIFALDTKHLTSNEARYYTSSASYGRKKMEDEDEDEIQKKTGQLTAEQADLTSKQWQKRREVEAAFDDWVRSMSADELAATIKAAAHFPARVAREPDVAAEIRAAQKRLNGGSH
jgi:hypothetical protein